MKFCPNCKLELPDEAHFCPKCMFQYEKNEIIIGINDKKPKHIHIYITSSILVICLFVGMFFITENSINNTSTSRDKSDSDLQAITNEHFKTEDNIMPTQIKNDLNDKLTDFSAVKELLGQETEPAYNENDMTIHTFGIVTTTVNNNGMVQDILIDYTNSENPAEYGIYGIDNQCNKNDVKAILGTPDQDYGDEFFYRFDREFTPSLKITFSSDGLVEQLEYYYVQ